MRIFDSKQELQEFLGLDNWRQLTADKVVELAELFGRGQLTEAAKAQVFAAAPELVSRVGQLLNDSNEKIIESNDESSKSVFGQFSESREYRYKIMSDPRMSAEEKAKALEEMDKVDEMVLEQDRNNKLFNLKLSANLQNTLIGSVALVAVVIAGAGASGKIHLPGK